MLLPRQTVWLVQVIRVLFIKLVAPFIILVRENGTLLESSRGLSGIDEIKQLFGAKTLTVDTGADNAAGKLTFNIDGLARAIAPLRDACHWAGE